MMDGVVAHAASGLHEKLQQQILAPREDDGLTATLHFARDGIQRQVRRARGIA